MSSQKMSAALSATPRGQEEHKFTVHAMLGEKFLSFPDVMHTSCTISIVPGPQFSKTPTLYSDKLC